MRARTVGRVLAGLAAGAAGAWLVLAGATALALRSDWLLGQIDADPDSLFVAFTQPRAFLLPGRIHFATLTLRSRDANVEWEALLEDVTVDVALGALTGRRFRAKRVRAAALTFRLRERLPRVAATPGRAARYPRIAGFTDPPLVDPLAVPASPGDPWGVVVEDLRIELVREIWIDAWRWEGKGRLSGGLFLRPGIQAEVFPGALDVESGTLHWGAHLVSRETAGRVQAFLPRFETHAFRGNEVWKIMSGSASLKGTLDDVGFLAPDGGGPQIAPGGPGTARLRVALKDGRGRARLDAQAAALIARVGDRPLRGGVRLEVFAQRIDFQAGTVDFDGTRAALHGVTRRDSPGAPWDGKFEARAARLRLADGSLDARLTGRLGDARPLVSLLPSGPPKWIAGLLDLRDFEAAARIRRGPGSLVLSPAHAEAGTFSIDADWREARGRRWGALLVRKDSLSLGLGLGDGGTSLHLAGAAEWFAGEGRPGGLRTDQPRGSEGPARASR